MKRTTSLYSALKLLICVLAFTFTYTLHAQATRCFKQIIAGEFHTVAIKTDGTLWVWGNNARGQVGDGTTTDKSSPVQVGTATNWAKVVACSYHSVSQSVRTFSTDRTAGGTEGPTVQHNQTYKSNK